jgi:acetyl-CoA C-acetyltransferase
VIATEHLREVLVTGGVRTAVGMHGGALKDLSATDLVVAAMGASLRSAGVAADHLTGLVVGSPASRAPEDLALESAAAASVGVPRAAPVLSVHRHEATGLQALLSAAEVARAGGGAVLMGAADSSSRTPLLVPGLRFDARDDESQVVDPLSAVRLDPVSEAHVILRDEQEADTAGIAREAQDAWALRSHERAAGAEGGLVPVAGIESDEGIRTDLTGEHLATLMPLFSVDGNVTGGNWAAPADGAAALTVMAGEAAVAAPDGAARLVAVASGTGAAPAARAALEQAGAGATEVTAAEVHESSAAHVLASVAALGLDPERVNAAGGAIATGSPQAAAGAIMLVRLLAELERRGGGVGLAAVSSLGGRGVAAVLQSA